MRQTQQSVRIITPSEADGINCLKSIEYAARNCYASQDKIADDSWRKFVTSLIMRKHETPLEFAEMTVDITTSRAVLAELTRHRMASFCVESQRYIQEAKTGDILFIEPEWYTDDDKDDKSVVWASTMRMCENAYIRMIDYGAKPEEARLTLPNSTACRIIMKANLREWRHIFKLRCSRAAYPPMRELMTMLLREASARIPVVFDDLAEEYLREDDDDGSVLLATN